MADQRAPAVEVVWSVLSLLYSVPASTSPIQDCDEVFNYLEPTHYLNHGHGLETWEYSPEHAIRSWAYAGLHALVVQLWRAVPYDFFRSKPGEFVMLRASLGMATAACTTALYSSIWRTAGRTAALVFLVIMATSAGMFHASVAYLPSAFAMNCTQLGYAAFLGNLGRNRTAEGIMWFGVGAIVGWPFAAILILPFLLEELWRAVASNSAYSADSAPALVRRWARGAAGCLAVLALVCGIDSFFYRKLAVVPLNIVLYNVFGGAGKGPDIYGTEPWHFYARNLVINFNMWFLVAFVSLPLAWLSAHGFFVSRPLMQSSYPISCLVPLYLWFFFMTAQPHKEERFMYPIYPAIALNASATIAIASSWMGQHKVMSRLARAPRLLLRCVLAVALIGTVASSGLRILGLVDGYSAPLDVYQPLHDKSVNVNPGDTVCLGKEWYRYPSSYLLPAGMRPKFIKSEFSGLLPGEFLEDAPGRGPWAGAHAVPLGMNDMNLEDPGKYVNVSSCSFLVDSLLPSMPATPLEPSYIGDSEHWERIRCERFLDAGSTPLVQRLLWMPERFGRRYGEYCLLRQKRRDDSSD